MWKKILMAVMVTGALAACSSTKPVDGTAGNGMNGMNGMNGANGSGMDGGMGINGSGMNGANGANGSLDPLKDPANILSKRSVYFDFDSSAINAAAKPIVEAHSVYLKKNTARKAVIQGNTDIRGSSEYNLALGQRRAESVKKMMRVLGVPEAQLEAVSFGKEKPRASGTTEADHAENRRDDIVYDGE